MTAVVHFHTILVALVMYIQGLHFQPLVIKDNPKGEIRYFAFSEQVSGDSMDEPNIEGLLHMAVDMDPLDNGDDILGKFQNMALKFEVEPLSDIKDDLERNDGDLSDTDMTKEYRVMKSTPRMKYKDKLKIPDISAELMKTFVLAFGGFIVSLVCLFTCYGIYTTCLKSKVLPVTMSSNASKDGYTAEVWCHETVT